MTSTSYEAIDAHVRSGKAKRQRDRILQALRKYGDMTRNDLERHFLDRPPRIRINAVCGRVGELLEDDQVEVIGERVDPETGHPGEILRAREPRQGRLF